MNPAPAKQPFAEIEKPNNKMNDLIDPSLITVGAILKTRGGYKARVLCIDRRIEYPPNPVVGLLDRGGEIEITVSWTIHGKCFAHPANDIISVWTDPIQFDWSQIPPWLNWLAMDLDKSWFLYGENPEICSDVWSADPYARIPTSYAPTWTGDWRQSLTCRPGFIENEK